MKKIMELLQNMKAKNEKKEADRSMRLVPDIVAPVF